MDFWTAAMLRTYQAAGLAFIFLPSNTLAYVGLPREKNNQVSAMNSFVRNIGGSIGIALISTAITRQAIKHQVYMSAHTGAGNPAFRQMADGMRQMLARRGAPYPMQQAYGQVAGIVAGQATTRAYIDIIYLLALVVVCLVPFVLIMRKPPRGAPTPAAH
jgi:DHA2 family multidrug resistance protein